MFIKEEFKIVERFAMAEVLAGVFTLKTTSRDLSTKHVDGIEILHDKYCKFSDEQLHLLKGIIFKNSLTCLTDAVKAFEDRFGKDSIIFVMELHQACVETYKDHLYELAVEENIRKETRKPHGPRKTKKEE